MEDYRKMREEWEGRKERRVEGRRDLGRRKGGIYRLKGWSEKREKGGKRG